MARLELDGDDVVVRLTGAEQVWSLRRGDVRVPRAAVTRATVVDDGLGEVRGLRAPGLALPGRIKVDIWRRRSGKELVSVRRDQPAVVVELTGTAWHRLVLGAPDRAQADRAAASVAGRPGR